MATKKRASISETQNPGELSWNSPIPQERWQGFRRENRGVAAFRSVADFEAALWSELDESLEDHEKETLAHLLGRGKQLEIGIFTRTHGPNPLFDPNEEMDIDVGVAKADIVDLKDPATPAANAAILNGEIVHCFFHAGDATRFQQGPFYRLKPVRVARTMMEAGEKAASESGESELLSESLRKEISEALQKIDAAASRLSPEVASFIVDGELGLKQPIFIRAALRRVVEEEIKNGRISPKQALATYQTAIKNQKLLFFVSQRADVREAHDEAIRKKFNFFGFDPRNVVTVDQELSHGIGADEEGRLALIREDWGLDAAGHLYALMQASRNGDFTTYSESGRPLRPREQDSFSYLLSRGGKFLNIIRINDMDRHTTEIINGKALSYALACFEKGYVNVVETVANPEGQKGGTGTTFGDPQIHVLTETHENSFPALSRKFEKAVSDYLEKSQGDHPAYNAMRQWADLAVTRRVLREFGGRIVFVPRMKKVLDRDVFYLGADLPMGDLTLLYHNYKSRMFQFAGSGGRQLLIHDMKKKENISIALRTILRQLEDPRIRAAVQEFSEGTWEPFSTDHPTSPLYGAPAPEFD